MDDNKPTPQDENPFFKILQKAEELMQEQEQNTARNAEISQEIGNLVGEIKQLPSDIKTAQQSSLSLISKAGNHVANEIKSAGNETVQRIENASKNVKGIKLDLNENDKKSIQSIKDNFSLFKTLKYVFGGILFLSALTLLGSGYLAKNWYDTSVQTKQEVREEVLKQISDEGSIIVSESEYIALRHERELIKGWVNGNPEDSKSYKTHRKAITNLEQNAERTFFKSPTNDELKLGGEKGFFD